MANIVQPIPAEITMLARALQHGELVAIPTETVYGLAGDARSDRVVARIFAVKGRPSANPLIAHYPSPTAMGEDVVIDPRAEALADAFWPGPLTLVLPRRVTCRVCPRASAELPTLAVRVPDHPATLALLRACNMPLVAPSANPSGRLSPVKPAHVERWLGDRIRWILDGGQARRGVESTIVDLSGEAPVLLREGTITEEQITERLGALRRPEEQTDRPAAPGTAFRHYAPDCPVLLEMTNNPRPGDALIAFGPAPRPAGFQMTKNLSPAGDLLEAAANLFAALHELEAAGAKRIFVQKIPEEGAGRAINDRLRRAAEATR